LFLYPPLARVYDDALELNENAKKIAILSIIVYFIFVVVSPTVRGCMYVKEAAREREYCQQSMGR